MQQLIYASVRFFETNSGGRLTPVAGRGCVYRPHLRVGPDGIHLGVCFVEGPEIISLGAETDVVLALVYSCIDYSALMPGVRFHLLEGPRVVGEGIVTET